MLLSAGLVRGQDIGDDPRVFVVGDQQRAAGDGQRAGVTLGAGHILRHAAAGVGVELAVCLLHLRHGAVAGAARSGGGEDALAARDVELIVAVVVGVGLVVGDHADDAAVDVQAGHDGSARRQLLGGHRAQLVAAVVEHFLDVGILDDGVGHVRGAHEVSSTQAASGQHTGHRAEVGADLGAFCVPLDRRGVGGGVGALGVEADLHLVALVGVVGDVLHDAAVGQHGLGGHGLLAVGNKVAQLVGVTHDKHLLALFRGELRVQGLAEAALAQLVESQGAARGHEGRSITLHVVALAQDGDAALAGSDEGRELAGAVAVLDQHILGGEDVARVIGREVAVAQEGRRGDELLHGHEQRVGVVEVKRHGLVLLLLVVQRVAQQDAGSAQSFLVGGLQGILAAEDQLVAGEVPGAVGGGLHIGGGADLGVVAEDGVGGQGLVGAGGGAEGDHLAVAAGAAGEGQHGAALEGGLFAGLLADGHSEHISDGLVGNDQAVIVHGADVFVESLAHYFLPPFLVVL